MSGSRRLIGLLGAICFAGATAAPADAADALPAAKPAAANPTGGPAKPKASPLAPAVAELQKEYQAFAKDPKTAKLREKSDYFGKTNPASADVTPEVVVKALEQSVSGGPGAEAYVKWQLLSAVAGKFPDDLVKRVTAVYRRAPSPGVHPGVNRRQLARAVQGMKKDQVAGVQKEFDQAMDQFGDQNRIFLSYRDELYARLPNKAEVLSAGLEDAASRIANGLNATPIFDNVAAGVRSWAITEATAGQVSGMINAVARLKESAAAEDNRPYNKVFEDKGIVKWKSEGGTLDPKKAEELIKFLEANASGSSAGGLKFKDGK